MSEETEKQETKIKVEDLPKEQEELTGEEARNVQGGDGTGNTYYVSTAGGGVWKTTDGGSLKPTDGGSR